MSTNDKTNKRLYRLDELSDYKVASDYPDVRGWELLDAEGRRIGKIDNLLVNKFEERVVYLDVEVNEELIKKGHEVFRTPASEGIHEYLNKEGEDHLVVPIGAVAIDEDAGNVVCNTISFDTFAQTNRYNKGAEIDREYEVKLLAVYYPEDEINPEEEDFYKRRYFNRNRS